MSTELNEAQLNFIPHLLLHCDTEKAAYATGIPLQTANEWIRNPKFRNELSFRRRILADRILDMLGKAVMDSVTRLHEIVQNTGSDQHAIKAASSVLDHYQKHYDQAELANRIEVLEEKARAK